MPRAGAELVAACVVVAIGGIVVWGAMPLLGVQAEGVGPGYLPLVYGIAIIGLAGLQAFKSVLALRRRVPVEPAQHILKFRAFFLFVVLVLYAVLMEQVGYLPATWLSLLACFGVSGRVTVVRSIAYSLIFAVASYALFTQVLEISLPRGVIGL